jgi:hypothetical protein
LQSDRYCSLLELSEEVISRIAQAAGKLVCLQTCAYLTVCDWCRDVMIRTNVWRWSMLCLEALTRRKVPRLVIVSNTARSICTQIQPVSRMPMTTEIVRDRASSLRTANCRDDSAHTWCALLHSAFFVLNNSTVRARVTVTDKDSYSDDLRVATRKPHARESLH